MLLIGGIIFAVLCLANAGEVFNQIKMNQTYSQTIKISAQNYTQGFQVNWGDVEQLHASNKYLQLVIQANVTKKPINEYQIPILCINNNTAATIKRQSISQQPHIETYEYDFYGYKSNIGLYRIDLNSSIVHKYTDFYLSFFDLNSFANKDLHLIPVGNIQLSNESILGDDNYWEIQLEIGIYQANSIPLDCKSRGNFNEITQRCDCEQDFVGVYCEFQLKNVTRDVAEKVIIQPYEFALFRFDYEDLNYLILDLNYTAAFSFFFFDHSESDDLLQVKFIQTFFARGYPLEHKKNQQVFPLTHNADLNGMIFWFKNYNNLPVDLEFVFKEANKTFLEEFLQILVSYLFYTLVFGFLFCGCSFCMVVLGSKIHKQWTIYMRKRQMEKQLPMMTYLQFKQNELLHRETEQTTCSICLGEYENQDKIRVTWCRHAFHKECIEEWALKKNQCPFCRETIFTYLYSSIVELFQRNVSRNNRNNNEENRSEVPVNVQLTAPSTNNNIQEQNNRYQNLVETA